MGVAQLSALHRAWLFDRAARTVNVLLATASCGHPDDERTRRIRDAWNLSNSIDSMACGLN